MSQDLIVLTGSRARRLRKRAYVLGVEIREIAAETGYPPVRVSKVLSEIERSEPMLDKIEAILHRVALKQGAIPEQD